jgi:hypothetical protein
MNQFRNHMDVVFFHFFPFKSLIKFWFNILPDFTSCRWNG